MLSNVLVIVIWNLINLQYCCLFTCTTSWMHQASCFLETLMLICVERKWERTKNNKLSIIKTVKIINQMGI